MSKVSFVIIIVVVSVISVACEQNYAGINPENPQMIRARQSFDMEGETIEVNNNTSRKLVVAELHLPEGDDVDVQLHQVTFRVSGGHYIDWDATVIALDSMLLAPIVEVKDISASNQYITITWGQIPWQTHGNNKHNISLNVMFKEDVTPGTVIEFWTLSTVFKSNGQDPVYMYGDRDINLGQEYFSGALYHPVKLGDKEEEFMPKVPRLVVVEE